MQNFVQLSAAVYELSRQPREKNLATMLVENTTIAVTADSNYEFRCKRII